MDETGRRFEIEVTPEMIEAGGDVIAQHMTDWEVCRISDDQYLVMIYRAMAPLDNARLPV